MQLKDLNWMDVERYLERDNRIILVTGATEQHAYLSLMTDILIPSRIAETASRRERVLVAPALNFGFSEEFMDFPGTISLSLETFDVVVMEILRSLLRHGFTRFFFINGHGGNRMPPAIHDLQMDNVLRAVWYDWWRSPSVAAFERKYRLHLDHANWGENFSFTRVGLVPDGEKPLVNLEYLETGQSTRDVLGDGSYGGLYKVDEDLMIELMDLLVDEVVSMLQQLRN